MDHGISKLSRELRSERAPRMYPRKIKKKISKIFFSKIRKFVIISELALNPANSQDGALEHFLNLNTLGHLSISVCRTDHQREAAAAIMDQTLRLMF